MTTDAADGRGPKIGLTNGILRLEGRRTLVCSFSLEMDMFLSESTNWFLFLLPTFTKNWICNDTQKSVPVTNTKILKYLVIKVTWHGYINSTIFWAFEVHLNFLECSYQWSTWKDSWWPVASILFWWENLAWYALVMWSRPNFTSNVVLVWSSNLKPEISEQCY